MIRFAVTIFLLVSGTLSSQRQRQEWYLESTAVSINDELNNAVYDPDLRVLVVFSDAGHNIWVLNAIADSSFVNTSAIMLPLSTYPTGSYGLLAKNNNVIFCETEQSTVCFKVDLTSGTVIPNTPRFNYQTGSKNVPSIFLKDDAIVSFATNYVFSYFDAKNMEFGSGKSLLESQTRPDGYIAGPTFEYNGFPYVVWLRPFSSSEDREGHNLIKVGQFCTTSKNGQLNFYVEKPFSWPLVPTTLRNVSTTLLREELAISSRLSTSALSLCYVTKEMIAKEINLAIDQCKNGSSAESPGFVGESDINAHVNCKHGIIKNKVATRGCDVQALFEAEQARQCLSPTTIDLQGSLSSFVDSAALVLSSNKALLFFTDGKGRFAKILVTKSGGDSYTSKLIGVHNNVAGSLQQGEHVMRMFVLDSYAQLVFVTSRQVIRIPASNCTQYSSCDSCVSSGDPLCAWCPSKGMCWMTKGAACPDIIGSESSPSASCPKLSAQDVDLDVNSELSMQLSPWPFAEKEPDSFFCAFDVPGSKDVKAEILGRRISCATPQLDSSLSPWTQVAVKLLAAFQPDGPSRKIEIATMSKLNLFKCSSLTRCSSCAGAVEGKCSWCFSSGTCNSRLSDCPRWPVNQKSKCPALDGIFNDQTNSVVPSLSYAFGTQNMVEAMRFRIYSGDEILNEASQLQCSFLRENGEAWGGRMFNAHKNGNYIVCNIHGLHAPDDTRLLPNTSREFVLKVIVLANARPIDYIGETNNKAMTLGFYSCSLSPFASTSLNTCGHCRALNPHWRCVWCESSRCVPQDNCPSFPVGGAICQASIKSFYPSKGPVNGGTSLTISTVDLDTEVTDLLVTVTGLACVVDQDRTRLPDTVVCTTSAFSGNATRTGHVKLYHTNQQLAISNNNYTYLPIMPDRTFQIQPQFGPQSGGTVLNITGRHFDIGSNRSVWLGLRPCQNVVVKSLHHLQCISSGTLDMIGHVPVHVIVDGFNSSSVFRPESIPRFEYRPDPSPKVLASHLDWRNKLRIATRGGSPIRVDGKNLDASAVPQFFVRLSDPRNPAVVTSPCKYEESSKQLLCRSPELSPSWDSSQLKYGLKFSETLESLAEHDWPQLEVTPNPEFTKATIDIATEILTISGLHLNTSFTTTDYNITIADRPCAVTTLNAGVVICLVSLKNQGLSENATGSFIPIENIAHSQVTVVLGGVFPPIIVPSLSSVDGTAVNDFLKYLMANPLPVLVPAAVGVVIVLILIILIACLCSRAKRENLRKFEKTKHGIVTQQQQQLTKFQRRIFADQTQVAPQEVRWNAELPFHKYREYCQNFFFPMVDDFRSIQTPPDVANIGVSELERFYRLLLRENFLIAFVNALENPHHFKHTDITRVAALLSVVLQPHMVYHTAVIRRLLDELILRTGQRNPTELKQLLRRAEHVVERLLANWLAMLLYDHVLSGPGQALFRLTRACHLKTTSGKVDPATGRSLYALSERSLLQDPSEPLEITLNIFDNVRSAIQSEEGRRTVTVLDCDTVAQAKAKILDAIYEGVPFSARLTPADCDIQFVQADGKRVDLPDDSQKNATNNGTLSNGKAPKPILIKSFNIENNTKVIIVRRPAGTYGTNTTSLKSVVSQQSSSGGGPASSGSGDSHSLLNGSPLMAGNNNLRQNGSTNTGGGIFYAVDHNGVSVSMAGDEQKTPGGTRRAGLLGNNRRRAGSDRGDKRGSRTSNASSAAAAAAIESSAPPSEYFLSLLLITKKSLQEHIDNLFASLFRIQLPTDSGFPLAIRYLFDVFDELGRKHGISDPEVVYCWKTNAVPLRFWVNLIQNPDYLLDVEVIEPVKHCLSVVTQALMDSCARDPQPLSHRSASNKQLFSEDVIRYRGYVQKYYSEIQQVDFGGPLDFTMNNYLSEQSHMHARSFDPQGALRRLAEAALRYSSDIDRQLRTGQGMTTPVPDGMVLAEEFAGIVRDLRIAGIGSLTTTNSGGAQMFQGAAATPGASSNNSGTAISFTATPVGVPGAQIVAPVANGLPLTRNGRPGSQLQHPSLPQQPQQPQQQVPFQNNQFIVMKHPTHL